MASGSSEPTRRMHHRSTSSDGAEERSKRRKHRHHRHHRSRKDRDETKEKLTIPEVELVEGGNESGVEEARLENSGLVNKTGLGFDGVDYDMEEGEIVDDGLVANKLKNLDSDVESGEIKPNAHASDSNTGVNDELMERVYSKSPTLEKGIVNDEKGGKLDLEIASDSQGPAHSDANRNHRDGDEIPRPKHKKTMDSDDDVEYRRSNRGSGPEYHDKFLKDTHKRSRSPERSRRRSRSRSILHETSTMGTPRRMEGRYHMKKEHRSESGEELLIDNGRNYRHSSRDYPREEERERSSSRYAERTERYFGRENRESSRDRGRERDRTREKAREREDKEHDRESSRRPDRDRSERDREMFKENTMGRERERQKDREQESRKEMDRDKHEVRMERNSDRDRFRDGVSEGARARSRDRERDRDNVNARFSRRQKYGNEDGNGDRERENGSSHRRYSDNHRERSNRTDKENLSSKDDLAERVNDKEQRGEDEGDYQQRISMQLAEQEEDDVERIKEESRRRRQAILEKYKNQQKTETQFQDRANERIAESADQLPSVEVNVQANSRGEGAISNAAESSFAVGKSPSLKGPPDVERSAGTGGLGAGTPKSERSDDMFRDDIFGESPAGVRKIGKTVAVERSGLNDNWDDAEGYYGYRFGEILDTRYEIIAAHGKGVFSTVVRAKDLQAIPGHPEVAIKIIRNNETMYKAGMDELVILNKLVGADPDNKRHCVRYLSNFKFRNHLCLVFESLHMNLRELLKKFGRNIGLKLTAVRTYAKQLFIALKHLRNCGVLHCDIKPDNMLVNEAKNVLKLCDFGNAMFSGKNEITPYLVSRFYRAPEIILGLPYDHPMDIWSVGCCLFELYTGKVLFPGATNNDMLRLHMELKGPFPKKMLRKGAFTDQHFDQDLNFLATEEDPVTKKIIRRLLVNIKPNDFGSLISGSSGEDPKMVSNFKDLMEKIFVLDPDKRLTVSQALSHPFITGKNSETGDMVDFLRDDLGGGF